LHEVNTDYDVAHHCLAVLTMTVATATPEDVLGFWFTDNPTGASLEIRDQRWFGRDAEFDDAIRARFAHDIRAAAAGDLDAWVYNHRGRLALIILMDQFTRNAFRGSTEAYALDASAVRICIEGLRNGADRELTPIERMFYYLPLLHSENLADQERSVERFALLRTEVMADQTRYFRGWLRLARRHRRVIARFGRFPHRNAIFERRTTLQEHLFLFHQWLLAAVTRGLRAFRQRLNCWMADWPADR
jgi:uncharacterized protein (DUF924 family)